MTIDVIRSKNRKKPGPRPEYRFALEFYRDDVPEQHEFTSHPVMDAGSLGYTLSADRKPERAIAGMTRTIRKMLADDDGTPLGYRPRPYDPSEPDAEPDGDMPVTPYSEPSSDVGELDDEEDPDAEAFEEFEFDPQDERLFVGPDGEPHPAADIEEALKFENGSSRRRFTYLMDEDDDLTLEVDQLETIYRRLMGKAANRPTRR